MTRVVLAALNARYTHSNPALFYLREAITDIPADLVLRQWTIRDDPHDLLLRLYREHPDAIGLSVYIWNAAIVRRLIPDLKKLLPEVVLFAGGPEITAHSNAYLADFPELDYLLPGPGEAPFRAFAQAGFTWPERVVHAEPIPFKDVRFPYRSSDFQLPESGENHGLHGRYVYYEASRGCPFSCTYCLSGNTRVERRPLSTVLTELQLFIDHLVPLVKFVDRTFNADGDFARSIWTHLASLNTITRFHFEIHPALLTDTDFALLKSVPAGRFQFEIGIQAVQPEILRRIGRHESWNRVQENIRRLLAFGNIHTHIDMLIGLPGQNSGHVEETFDVLSKLGAEELQLGFLKCLPGTPIEHEPGLYASSLAPYPVLRTDWLNPNELDDWHRLADLHDHLANSGLFRSTLSRVLPHWPSPTAFWGQLTRYWTESGWTTENRTWPVMAERFRSFLLTRVPALEGDFDDTLRFDWCVISSRHAYPPFLDYSGSKALKNRGIALLQNELPPEILTRTIFFEARSDAFPNYQGGIVAFLPDGERRILFPETRKLDTTT
jgi:hypothetical protein